MKKFILLITTFTLLFSLVVYSAQNSEQNQDVTTNPIKIIVPQAAGTDEDCIARIIAGTAINHFTEPVVVINETENEERTSDGTTVVMTATVNENLKPILQLNAKSAEGNDLHIKLAVPKDTSEEMVNILHERFKRILEEEKFKELMIQSDFKISL